VVGAAQTDDAPQFISAREHDAECTAAKRSKSNLAYFSIGVTIIYPAHEVIPSYLTRKLERNPMLKTIDGVFQWIKRDIRVHSLWFPKVEVTSREISEFEGASSRSRKKAPRHPASLHSSANLKVSL
jgi:hypothetical protein